MRETRRQGVCAGGVGSRDADVDGSRLTEVQHLVDDVGRLEEELQFGKALRQFTAQHGRQ